VTTAFEVAKKRGLVDTTCAPFSNLDWMQECPEFNSCEVYKAKEFCYIQGREAIKREI